MLMNRTWSAKVPRSAKDLLPRLTAAVEDLTSQLTRAPTPTELAGYLGVNLDAVTEAVEARSAYRASSLSSSALSECVPQLGAMDPGLDGVENVLTVRRLIAFLPEREREIVKLRFYDELTQSEIAKVIGLSQIHVSRLLKQALAKLGARATTQSHEIDV